MVWHSHLFQNFPQFIVIHTVKGFGIVNKAEIDVFLELSCFFDDPAAVGNLISGSSAFSKTSLNIWMKALLAILWNTAFRWIYLFFSPLPFASLLFTAICKASSDSHFAFSHFFFLRMVLIPVSCKVSQTCIRYPLNLLLISTV